MRDWWPLGVMMLGAFLIWRSYGIWIQCASPNNRGLHGDQFGGLNALFSGWAFAGVIYAIYLQSQELKLQRLDFRQHSAYLRDQLNLQTAEAINAARPRFASRTPIGRHAGGPNGEVTNQPFELVNEGADVYVVQVVDPRSLVVAPALPVLRRGESLECQIVPPFQGDWQPWEFQLLYTDATKSLRGCRFLVARNDVVFQGYEDDLTAFFDANSPTGRSSLLGMGNPV